jgi:hypothetical protein
MHKNRKRGAIFRIDLKVENPNFWENKKVANIEDFKFPSSR